MFCQHFTWPINVFQGQFPIHIKLLKLQIKYFTYLNPNPLQHATSSVRFSEHRNNGWDGFIFQLHDGSSIRKIYNATIEVYSWETPCS